VVAFGAELESESYLDFCTIGSKKGETEVVKEHIQRPLWVVLCSDTLSRRE